MKVPASKSTDMSQNKKISQSRESKNEYQKLNELM